ncbi:MAG: hypothetical protein HY671_14050 [Chloroflexi bacterium]|nr:hypothetical protein [Chloroflexota bacterium]
MENIKEPGPLLYAAVDPAVKYLRETAHPAANRSLESRKRLTAFIEKIDAEAAVSAVTGFEDASESLDEYLY